MAIRSLPVAVPAPGIRFNATAADLELASSLAGSICPFSSKAGLSCAIKSARSRCPVDVVGLLASNNPRSVASLIASLPCSLIEFICLASPDRSA